VRNLVRFSCESLWPGSLPIITFSSQEIKLCLVLLQFHAFVLLGHPTTHDELKGAVDPHTELEITETFRRQNGRGFWGYQALWPGKKWL